jgi:hypothetical protein
MEAQPASETLCFYNQNETIESDLNMCHFNNTASQTIRHTISCFNLRNIFAYTVQCHMFRSDLSLSYMDTFKTYQYCLLLPHKGDISFWFLFPFLLFQAVDIVGKAGTPKTVTGVHTHNTPVLLATQKYIPLTPVMEGFGISQKKTEQ